MYTTFSRQDDLCSILSSVHLFDHILMEIASLEKKILSSFIDYLPYMSIFIAACYMK